jgi:hypothetical protein
MTLVSYSKGKLLLFAALFIPIVLIPVIGWLLLLVPLRLAYMAFGDLKALESTEQGLVTYNLWGATKINWNDYVRCERQGLRFFILGFIPLPSISYLHVVYTGGVFGTKKVRMIMSAMALNETQLVELQTQLRSLASMGAAKSQLVESRRGGSTAETKSFDPDAAIARYLASKNIDTGSAENNQQQRRPLLNGEPLPITRPSFGRRGSN